MKIYWISTGSPATSPMVPARRASELQEHTWIVLSVLPECRPSQRNRRALCGHRSLFTFDVAPCKTAHVSASDPRANHGDPQPSFISLVLLYFLILICVLCSLSLSSFLLSFSLSLSLSLSCPFSQPHPRVLYIHTTIHTFAP